MRISTIRIPDPVVQRKRQPAFLLSRSAIDAQTIAFASSVGAAFVGSGSAPTAITLATSAGASFTGAGVVPTAVTLAVKGEAAFVQHVLETGLLQADATVGAAFVAGAYRQITVGPPDALPQSAPPTVTGGAQLLSLIIGNQDLSAYHMEENADVQSQTIGRWTATTRLRDYTGTLATLFAGANGGVGLSIIIQEFGYKLFAGCIQQVVSTQPEGTDTLIFYDITATDKSAICDHRIVKTPTYTSDQDAADVIRDIVQNYLNGEGINTAAIPVSLGALGSDLHFNFNTVTNAFDQVGTLIASVWWIDVNGGLHFSTLGSLPAAPLSLTTTSNNWRNLKSSSTLLDYRNKQYVVSNLNVIPAGGGGSPALQVSETYTIPQTAATAAGYPSGYVVVNLPISSVTEVKVNGVSKPAYDYISNPAAPPYGTVDCWYFLRGGSFLFPAFAPGAGATIIVIYVPLSGNVASQSGEALAPTTPGLGQCGSGVYESVEQVQGIQFRDDLNAIAQAILDKAGGVPVQVDFETDYPGLAPGQLLPINIPFRGLNAVSYLVTQVSGHSFGATLGHSSTFRWQVTCRSNQDPGNYIKWFERLIRRTEQPTPILQVETHTFILGPGQSLSGGASATNPVPVEQPGQLYRLTIAAATPPVGQDLTVTLTVNNIPVGSVTMPAGTAANTQVIFTFDTANPIYVYTDDIENVDVTYTNIGGSPTAAANVTVTASHSV